MHPNTPEQSSVESFAYDYRLIDQLLSNPINSVQTSINGEQCVCEIISPNYVDLISQHYMEQLQHGLDYYHDTLCIPTIFSHFGLRIEFSNSTEISLHEKNMVLPQTVKDLVNHFGVVILQNIYLNSSVRDLGHRNRFPQLNFHVDRIPSQGSYYSVYTRNPFDDEQKYPRTSSTLFIPTLVAYLQGMAEGKTNILTEKGLISSAILFDEKNIKSLINNIVVEHAWNKPTGTGEVSLINNCNMLHASYYPNIHNKGYRIGVRYLA